MSRRRRGYTLLEVMTAVAVMIVAGTGFIMMQGAGTRAVILARERTIANSIAQRWVDRVRRESLAWTSAGPSTTPNLSQPFGEWFLANATYSGAQESSMIDGFGDDILGGDDTRVRFYVALNLSSAHTDTSGNTDAIRVDVDVFWPRSAQGMHMDAETDTVSVGSSPLAIRSAWGNSGHVLHAFATTVVMPGGGAL